MKGQGTARRISARPGSPWRRNPDALRLARALRKRDIAEAQKARAGDVELQAALARERMHQRH
jgi:hypothetical protein